MFRLTGVLALMCILFSHATLAREATVLLITDESLAQAWKPFAEFKTQIGFSTEVVTVQSIERDYEGEDTPAKIRKCTLNAIENEGVRFVILGGDSKFTGAGLVPHRITQHTVPMSGEPVTLPADLYYISPGEMDWDANDDGVYGEWEEDRDAVAYTHPSGACIGRIPVRTVQDVAAYTAKVRGYEMNYPSGNFAERIVYTNTVDASEPKVRRSWDEYLSKAWQRGEAYRFLHTETHWDEKRAGDYALNAKHWLQRINDRTASKMHMHGHGFLPAWVLEHRTGNSYVSPDVVKQLSNKDAYLVMTTVSCFTGQFDGLADPCITESMLRAPEKGAVAIVAPTRPGVPVFHDPRKDMMLMITEGKLDGTTESMTRFWMNGLRADPNGSFKTMGEAYAAMKGQMADHARRTSGYHWCQCELVLLGDPTLDFRAREPVQAEVQVAGDGALKLGQNTLELSTNLIGHPGAVACAWKEEELYKVEAIDEEGRARFDFSAPTPGTIRLGVRGPSVNAWLGSVELE